jgi:hypothetical protein
MGYIISSLIGYAMIGAFWLVVSYLAYHLSVVIKRTWPLGIICGVSVLFSWGYSLVLFFWYLFTTFTIFKEGSLIFALLFFFIIGGIITSVLMTLVNIVASIPLGFMEKLESRLLENEIIDIDVDN